ncbi:KH homology domain-containing protein 4 [Frankliniella fusca]|uniref:KH homology domain-containing protein 4 n=1 Tax=Frankliniella fusca TaxID=407009 RepID=A0AAE1I0Q6_9NEOP|nr:KH homology domain-containing protein 4 [Frankliniella fusca]
MPRALLVAADVLQAGALVAQALGGHGLAQGADQVRGAATHGGGHRHGLDALQDEVHVGDLVQRADGEVLEQRDGREEAEVLLNALHPGAHHDLLEHLAVQNPDLQVAFQTNDWAPPDRMTGQWEVEARQDDRGGEKQKEKFLRKSKRTLPEAQGQWMKRIKMAALMSCCERKSLGKVVCVMAELPGSELSPDTPCFLEDAVGAAQPAAPVPPCLRPPCAPCTCEHAEEDDDVGSASAGVGVGALVAAGVGVGDLVGGVVVLTPWCGEGGRGASTARELLPPPLRSWLPANDTETDAPDDVLPLLEAVLAPLWRLAVDAEVTLSAAIGAREASRASVVSGAVDGPRRVAASATGAGAACRPAPPGDRALPDGGGSFAPDLPAETPPEIADDGDDVAVPVLAARGAEEDAVAACDILDKATSPTCIYDIAGKLCANSSFETFLKSIGTLDLLPLHIPIEYSNSGQKRKNILSWALESCPVAIRLLERCDASPAHLLHAHWGQRLCVRPAPCRPRQPACLPRAGIRARYVLRVDVVRKEFCSRFQRRRWCCRVVTGHGKPGSHGKARGKNSSHGSHEKVREIKRLVMEVWPPGLEVGWRWSGEESGLFGRKGVVVIGREADVSFRASEASEGRWWSGDMYGSGGTVSGGIDLANKTGSVSRDLVISGGDAITKEDVDDVGVQLKGCLGWE